MSATTLSYAANAPLNRRMLTAHQLATLLGRSYDWVMRPANMAELYGMGFPRPVSGPKRHKRWSTAAVIDWLDRASYRFDDRPITPPPSPEVEALVRGLEQQS